ncbi:putative quinol monooxygenase [Intrasporangium sp.]|uniref:putative quinol monooxygenase n=1 Tax=Intrasporangium sp. TaxID=1925024 RepID=UPI003221E15D
MFVVIARFTVRPERAGDWPQLVSPVTEATRAEPGCLWFDWSRSLDDPGVYVLLEGFAEQAVWAAHARSEHFRAATGALTRHLVRTPDVITMSIPGDGWSRLEAMAVPD